VTSAVDHIERIESVLYRIHSQPTSVQLPEPFRSLSPPSALKRASAAPKPLANGLDGDFSDGH
jgi:hypothetical protein